MFFSLFSRMPSSFFSSVPFFLVIIPNLTFQAKPIASTFLHEIALNCVWFSVLCECMCVFDAERNTLRLNLDSVICAAHVFAAWACTTEMPTMDQDKLYPR